MRPTPTATRGPRQLLLTVSLIFNTALIALFFAGTLADDSSISLTRTADTTTSSSVAKRAPDLRDIRKTRRHRHRSLFRQQPAQAK